MSLPLTEQPPCVVGDEKHVAAHSHLLDPLKVRAFFPSVYVMDPKHKATASSGVNRRHSDPFQCQRQDWLLG